VQRAADRSGRVKSTKTTDRRTVRLLAALAQEIREFKLAAGRPPETALIVPGDDGKGWTKTDWQCWRVDRWAHACKAAGLEPIPRPYDLRHSFASLLLAEGRPPMYVARQLGHSVVVLLRTYSHLIDEYAERERIDAEQEISAARREACSHSVPASATG
jgi:integrase